MTQKFSGSFKSLSRVDKDLKFEIFSPNSPRNITLSITTKEGKFMFKQPKIDTLNSIEPFENETNYYQNFYKFGQDFFCNRYKKYLILPFIETDRMQALKFFINKKFESEYTKSFVDKSISAINQFHQISNDEKDKKKFLRNSYSAIEPIYFTLLVGLRKAYLTKKFETILFKSSVQKNRKSVRLLIIEFLKEEKIVKFFLQLFENQKFRKGYLIHNDMNVNNMRGVINDNFKMIDFELVCLGDPLWDYVCYVESVFSRYLTNIDSDIYKIRFEVLINFLKGFLKNNDLSKCKVEIEEYLNFLIINKLKYLLDDNSGYAESEEMMGIVMQSIRNLIDHKKVFVDLIINGQFDNNCIPFLLAPGCNN